MSQAENDQTQSRRDKLAALRQQGIQPYGAAYPKPQSIQALVAGFAEGQAVSTAGRLMAKRTMGKMSFADLRDASGKIQISLKQDRLGEAVLQLFHSLDLGDIVGVAGGLFKTRTGEVTVQVDELTILAKALRPMPEKWHGLKDVEIRYRRRYLDLIANEPVRQVFLKRAQLISSLRRTLEGRGFMEVETPMMHPLAGGAAGEPFVTHHHALDVDLYMRLAPELYLKQLLVGGLERVYELNRSFRNEGLSTRHNPEFTMLEAYQAYGDCAAMMELVEALIKQAAQDVLGTLQFTYQGQAIDLSVAPWPRLSFADTLAKLGLPPGSSPEQIQRVLQEKKGIKLKELTRSQLVRLVEELFEPKTHNAPLFVVDFWTELSPLAKAKTDNPLVADRFELFMGGMEVANAYSELNDPIEQRKRFEAQLAAHGPQAGDKRIDEDFVEALEYGMPPAGGLGVGIDRLAMLLLDQPSIKDVVLFPLLKPSQGTPEGPGA
jgi:lysyl-tRNA synthetase class 2